MLTIPLYLTRDFVRSRPDVTFIFEMTQTRLKHCGPTKDMEGLSNTFWIPTKVKCCMDESAFFTDALSGVYEDLLDSVYAPEFQRECAREGAIIVPDPQIGITDWSGSLRRISPKCFAALNKFIAARQTPHNVNYKL